MFPSPVFLTKEGAWEVFHRDFRPQPHWAGCLANGVVRLGSGGQTKGTSEGEREGVSS